MSILRFERSMLDGREIFVRRKYKNTSYPITHWHDYYEIIMYRHCKGFCVMNGKEFKIENTCIFLLTPTDFHRIETEEIPDAYTINISFSENIIDKQLRENSFIKPSVLYNPDDYIINTIKLILSVFSENDNTANIQISHLLNNLIIMLARSGTTIDTNNMCVNPIVNNAINYILTDISEQHSLSEISYKCGVSPSYFSRVFLSATGIHFKKWLDNIRIDYAKRLCETTDMRILEISLECGYNSSAHFIRAFREATGETPSAYRKKFRNEKSFIHTHG